MCTVAVRASLSLMWLYSCWAQLDCSTKKRIRWRLDRTSGGQRTIHWRQPDWPDRAYAQRVLISATAPLPKFSSRSSPDQYITSTQSTTSCPAIGCVSVSGCALSVCQYWLLRQYMSSALSLSALHYHPTPSISACDLRDHTE